MGRSEEGLAVVAEAIPAIELSAAGEGNYPMLLHAADTVLWVTQRTEHVEVIERNLHAKFIEPDFCYPESDARWTAALLCALTGRSTEAREWFSQARPG